MLTRIEFALRQIETSRMDTLKLLADLDDPDWLHQPFAGANHIVWQVGHLTVAEYGLTIGEVLGRSVRESPCFSIHFRGLFKRGSTLRPDASLYPTPAEMRGALNQTHLHVMHELRRISDKQLDDPCEFGHPLANTKLEALHLCARHEAIHAGQIAMIRRSLSKPPIR